MDNVNETIRTETSSEGGLSISEAASRFADLLEPSEEETAEGTEGTEDNSAPSEVTDPEAEAETPSENPEADGDEAEDAGSEGDEKPEEEPLDLQSLTGDEEITVKGKTVKLSELPGFMKHEDWKQKTREIAETKRVLAENANTARGEVLEHMDALRREYRASLPPMPDFGKLVDEDPDEYIRQKHIWDERTAAIHKFEREYQAIAMEKQQAEQKHFEETRNAAHNTLREWHPELNDPTTGQIVTQNFGKWLNGKGFPTETIMGETNPMVLSMAFQLFQYEQAKSNATKAVAKVDAKQPLTPPGATTTKPAQSEFDKARAKAKASGGKPEHVANAWAQLL